MDTATILTAVAALGAAYAAAIEATAKDLSRRVKAALVVGSAALAAVLVQLADKL
jgi:hypothetical protein